MDRPDVLQTRLATGHTDTEHPHDGTPTVAKDLEPMPTSDEEDPFGVWIRWTNIHEPKAKLEVQLDEATHPIVPLTPPILTLATVIDL